MKLVRYKVTNFRSVEDSGWIDVSDVTALTADRKQELALFIRQRISLGLLT